ncbi:MAG: DUF5659 domain-containing protein [Candidatus Kurthia intestinigallinarum]
MNKYFYCYSWPLKEFLIQNGCEIVMYSKNLNTKKTFWVFENSRQITSLLDEWRLRKK